MLEELTRAGHTSDERIHENRERITLGTRIAMIRDNARNTVAIPKRHTITGSRKTNTPTQLAC